MNYTVYIADNFHYGENGYTYAEFKSAEEAINAAKKIVNAYLKSACKKSMNAENSLRILPCLMMITISLPVMPRRNFLSGITQKNATLKYTVKMLKKYMKQHEIFLCIYFGI